MSVYNLLLGLVGAGGTRAEAIAASSSSASPYVSAYPWSAATGFGTKYTAPATLPTAGTYGLSFNETGTAMVMSVIANAALQAWGWNVVTGFGTKYTNPAAFGNSSSGLSFNLAGTAVAYGRGDSPYHGAIRWTDASGWGSFYTNPSASVGVVLGPPGFAPSGAAVAFGCTNGAGGTYGNLLYAYPWTDAGGFGTRYTFPSPTQGNNISEVVFNPAGNLIAIADTLSPRILVWAWSDSTGFGTKYTDPAYTVPGSDVYSYSGGNTISFNPTGTDIALGFGTTPFIAVWPWSSGFGTKYSNPSTLPGDAYGVAFSKTSSAIACSGYTSPYINSYIWSSGFGTKYSNPATLPSAGASKVKFTY